MIDPIEKVVVADTLTEVLKRLAKRLIANFLEKGDKRSIAEAITAIQFACIRTRNFIDDNGYKRNEDLTKLWHDAFNKVIAADIDEDLPDYLYQKAKFWGKPEDWIANPGSLELVPKLRMLEEKCEIIKIKLK